MKREFRLRKLGGIATAGLAMIVVPAESFAGDAETSQACGSIENDAARLACYDAAPGPKQAPAAEGAAPDSAQPVAIQAQEPSADEDAPAAAPDPAAEPEPVTEPGTLSDEVGSETVKDASAAAPDPAAEPEPVTEPGTLSDEVGSETVKDVKIERLSVRGELTRCQKDQRGRYVFYFDNGQVWQQRGKVYVRWKDCAFGVTITKDLFGYVMVRDGDKRKIRIARIK